MRRIGWIATTGVLALGALAGCGDEGGEEVVTGAPTAEFMAQSATKSQETSARFEAFMSMSGIPGAPSLDDVRLMTGETDGARTHMVMNLDEMFDQLAGSEEMPPQLSGMDLSMEMVADPETLYIKSGLLAMAAGFAGGDELESLAELDDSWGKIDLEAFGDLLPGDVAKQLGGQGADPTAMLDVLKEVGEVEELGSETQNGVALTGYAANVSYADMLEAQGMSAEDFSAMLGEDAPDVVDAILELETPIEVWVDDAGYVRREVMTIDGAAMADAFGATDLEVPEDEEMGSLVVEMDMRFSDYGADDISVEVPEDAVDITEAFQSLIEMGGAGLGG